MERLPPAPHDRSLAATAGAVAARHAEISARAEAFAAQTGLACPPGCGACCLSPTVESSVVDLLPAAIALFERGDAAAVHACLRAAAGSEQREAWTRCVLYRPEPGFPEAEGRGRCGLYSARPSICRTFGYAARRAKRGTLELATCKVLRAADPESAARAQTALDAGIDAPRIDRDSMEIARSGGADSAPVPINAALLQALERVGLERALRPAAASDDGDPSDRPQRPQTPRRPRRAA
jgi:Fe-S-cluster containining protein